MLQIICDALSHMIATVLYMYDSLGVDCLVLMKIGKHSKQLPTGKCAEKLLC